jgi:hypothetical protein
MHYFEDDHSFAVDGQGGTECVKSNYLSADIPQLQMPDQ